MATTPLDRLQALTGNIVVEEDLNVAERHLSNDVEPDRAVAQANGTNAPITIKHNEKLSRSLQADTETVSPPSDVSGLSHGKPIERVSQTNIRGELGLAGDYCPILAVSKFPYAYMDPKSKASDTVSKKCFAGNQFWKNIWNIYYVHLPSTISVAPLLVVRKAEVESFLEKVKLVSGFQLAMPSASDGFVACFNMDGAPLPRYLGLSTCREEFEQLKGAVPNAKLDFQEHRDGTVVANCDQKTFEEWAAKVERAVIASKNRNKASKGKRRLERVQLKLGWLYLLPFGRKRLIHRDWSRELRRAQRYLGLRAAGCGSPITSSPQDPDQAMHPSSDLIGANSNVVDLEKVTVLPFDCSVIFVSIDIEVYERCHQQVTEIGLAFLDTMKLQDIPPGKGGTNWIQMVKGRHLRIKEHVHLVNREFVAGCPDQYESSFGTSEIVTTKEAVAILQECFLDPLLLIPHGSSKECSSESAIDKSESNSSDCATGSPCGARKIVVVGHDISQDIGYLKSIGFDVTKAANVLEIMDTSELYRTMRHEDNAPSLSSMLYAFGISGWNLHNAGNDAGYTLQSFVGITVHSITQNVETRPDPTSLINEAKQAAEDRVRESLEEWQLASDDDMDKDGGHAKSPLLREPRKQKRHKALTANHGNAAGSTQV